jgi:DNA processing protein
VPLRWGAPRILVFSGGFHHHLGPDLKEEPFRAARLWRYQFDAKTDLVISRRAPDKLPTFARFNPTVDRLIQRIVAREVPGLLFEPRT